MEKKEMVVKHFGIPASEESIPEFVWESNIKPMEDFPLKMLVKAALEGVEGAEKEYLVLLTSDLVFHYRTFWGGAEGRRWGKMKEGLGLYLFHGVKPCIYFTRKPQSSTFACDPKESVGWDIGTDGYPLAAVIENLVKSSTNENIHGVRAIIPQWQNKRWKESGGKPVKIDFKVQLPLFLGGFNAAETEYEQVIQAGLNRGVESEELLRLLQQMPITPGWNIKSREMGKLPLADAKELAVRFYSYPYEKECSVIEMAVDFWRRCSKKRKISQYLTVHLRGEGRPAYIFLSNDRKEEPMIVIMKECW